MFVWTCCSCAVWSVCRSAAAQIQQESCTGHWGCLYCWLWLWTTPVLSTHQDKHLLAPDLHCDIQDRHATIQQCLKRIIMRPLPRPEQTYSLCSAFQVWGSIASKQRQKRCMLCGRMAYHGSHMCLRLCMCLVVFPDVWRASNLVRSPRWKQNR